MDTAASWEWMRRTPRRVEEAQAFKRMPTPANGDVRVNRVGGCVEILAHDWLREHIRPNLPANLNDRIGRDVVSSSRGPNSFRIRRVVEAIGLFLVSAKEREDPLHAFLIIDQIDLFHPLLCEVELFRKISFDNVAWHEESPFSTC